MAWRGFKEWKQDRGRGGLVGITGEWECIDGVTTREADKCLSIQGRVGPLGVIFDQGIMVTANFFPPPWRLS